MLWTSLFLVFLGILMPALALFSKKQLDAGFVLPRIRFYLESMFFLALILCFAVFIADRLKIPLVGGDPPTIQDMALGVLALGAGLVAMWASVHWSPPEMLERVFMIAPETYDEKLTWIFVSATAALAEETAYRAVLFEVLNDLVPNWWIAVGITSLAFAGAHLAQGWISTGIVLVYAVVFQLLYLYTGTLAIPVIAHFLYDVAAGLYLAEKRPHENV